MSYDLQGAVESTLDNKGRFRMPSELMKQLGEDCGRRFMINRGLDPCLTLYPMDVWQEEKKKVRARIDPFNPAHRQFEMIYIQGAMEVELDANDRILIPKRFIEFADLEKEIILSTMEDKINIWNKARHDEIFKIDSALYSSLAFDVMGKKD